MKSIFPQCKALEPYLFTLLLLSNSLFTVAACDIQVYLPDLRKLFYRYSI